MHLNFKKIALMLLLPATVLCAVEWLPADRRLPELPPLKPLDEWRISSPDGVFSPGAAEWKLSLDGVWKFSGLASSVQQFAVPSAAELDFVRENFDDSGWESITVPLNWYRVPKYDYKKVLKAGAGVDPGGAGGADTKNVINNYFKGSYRRTFELPSPLPGGRLELQFDGIGYEAEIYLNGKYAGHHQGEFNASRFDVTDLAKPGENLVALRVLSNFRPPDGKFTHTYGAMWDPTCFKGGIWLPVRIVAKQTPVLNRILLSPQIDGDLRLDYEINHTGEQPRTVIPAVTVANARDFSETTRKEYPEITLQPGLNRGTLTIRHPNPKLWSPEAPHLYYAALQLCDETRTLAAAAVRFGFREFKVNPAGTGFLLNGKPIYLYFESLHSVRFGGHNTADGNSRNPREVLEGHRQKGYNMLRTAHMPVRQEVLDLADELGMMIYDEWGFCFIEGIHEAEFEKNNLSELERFIRADYNHPSVVMWSLGNEVPHRRDPAIARQLEKQTGMVRQLDHQKRPICAFAGNGNVDSYGRTYIDTDVVDLHLYTGITMPWTSWNEVFNQYYRWGVEIFGDGKTLRKPVIISECIGGGWGMRFDPSFQLGDIDRYLELIKAPYTWGNPGAAGYSGSIGVAAATDKNRGYHYLQNRLGKRIAELLRQDSRIAGFAPWLAEPHMRNAVLWNQPVYPGLRYAGGDGGLFPRQLRTPGNYQLEAFVLNQNGAELAAPVLKTTLAIDGKEQTLGEFALPASSNGKISVQPVRLSFPSMAEGAGEVRLTLFDGAREIARNAYAVTLHPDSVVSAAAEEPLPVALLGDDAETEALMRELKIPFQRVEDISKLKAFSRALLPPSSAWRSTENAALRKWVRAGGFLLILEPTGTELPGFDEYLVAKSGNPLIEVVVPSHPVFAGMTQDDFDTWAENAKGNVANYMLAPLNSGALAAKGATFHNRSVGASLVEVTDGKGRLIVSTLQALPIRHRNGAAAAYLGNLFRYFSGERDLYAARRIIRDVNRQFSLGTPKNPECLDLKKFANRDFSDETADDGKGGWTDQGNNDMRNLPKGKNFIGGIPFEIIDPAQNGGKGCLILKGREKNEFPEAIRNIPVNRKVVALYFLNAAAYVPYAVECGSYLVHYADGKSQEVKLVSSYNINDWWNMEDLPGAVPAFRHTNPAGGEVGLFVTPWNNPRPDVEVRSFDFLSAPRGQGPVPILAAVTLEPAPERVVPLYPASAQNVRWGVGSEPDGEKTKAVLSEAGNPAGVHSTKLDFPATDENRIPYAILFFDPAVLKHDRLETLSFLVKSSTGGVIDIVLPKSDWSSTMSAPINLDMPDNGWRRIRLDLKKDFRFTGPKFDRTAMRPELLLYNGKHPEFGFPRKAVSLEIADVRFE